MAAPSLVSYSFATGTPAAAATLATPTSVTWQASDVVIVMANTEGQAAETWSAPTTTGTGLTFAQQQLHPASSDPGAGCWGAVASAGSSGTFSIKQPNNVNATAVSIAVFIWRGSAGIGTSNISTGTSRTVSLTPSGVDGAVMWSVGDWAAATVQTATPAASSHTAASPGPQASPSAAVVTGRYTYYFEELDDQTSAGAVSYGIGGTGTGPFTIIAVEVKASGGAAATAPHRQRMSPVPIIRAANF